MVPKIRTSGNLVKNEAKIGKLQQFQLFSILLLKVVRGRGIMNIRTNPDKGRVVCKIRDFGGRPK